MSGLNKRVFGNRWLMVLVAVSALSLVMTASWAQQADNGGGGRDRGGRGWNNMSDEDRAQMMERFRERMEERRKEADKQLQDDLGMAADEFAVVNPMIQRVRSLAMEQVMTMRGGQAFGAMGPRNDRRGGPGNAEANNNGAPAAAGNDASRDRGNRRGGFGQQMDMSEQGKKVQQAMTALNAAVADKATSPDVLKAKMKDLRDARTALANELAKARADLRAVVVTRQEAVLVTMGVLD